jgi:hypothetical protein
MLLACRLAGLSALEAHYAGIKARMQSGASGSELASDQHPAAGSHCAARSWLGSPRTAPDAAKVGAHVVARMAVSSLRRTRGRRTRPDGL